MSRYDRMSCLLSFPSELLSARLNSLEVSQERPKLVSFSPTHLRYSPSPMSLNNLVGGGADCGPVNPLMGLTKRFNEDRSAQQARLREMRRGTIDWT
ncbi:hypothetical protein M427DRAFT_391084 [Gonapodya prolifera JEL478]|uniref:Uncharacterized protein n=1 Tax=Gonapodya prolifera (strain JEL478) TaxID=1344416 RepID=A0A139A7E2_GONPJ|nr:hypothetical protein M427DRAFT_391084 [Gonapodya prolifera JEL478]|eukprot:KXS12716.1 hypothetical protein M427DRAFT_391084 [Gonapodya prolifera JEL478]